MIGEEYSQRKRRQRYNLIIRASRAVRTSVVDEHNFVIVIARFILDGVVEHILE
jgi:hypothetical protein